MLCENCNEEHDSSYGSGRFCGNKCARGYSTNKDDRKEKILKNCSICQNSILVNKRAPSPSIKCDECKNKIRERIKEKKRIDKLNKVPCIKNLSKRTITKIFKRANIGCSICDWKESTCDLHHIIHRKDGGLDNDENLVLLCPNHHRIVHDKTLNKYDVDYLKIINLSVILGNWKDYYYGK